MNKEKQRRLEAAGWKVTDAAGFLGLDDEERRIVELRVALCKAIRRRREAAGLTQEELAEKIGSSTARIAWAEVGSSTVSLDLAFQALFAAGGGLADLVVTENGRPRKAPPTARETIAAKKVPAKSERTAGVGEVLRKPTRKKKALGTNGLPIARTSTKSSKGQMSRRAANE